MRPSALIQFVDAKTGTGTCPIFPLVRLSAVTSLGPCPDVNRLPVLLLCALVHVQNQRG